MFFLLSTNVHALAIDQSKPEYKLEPYFASGYNFTREQLELIGIGLFPEYSTQIKGESLKLNLEYLARGYDEVVFSETRMLSDNICVTYQERKSGISDLLFSYGRNQTGGVTGSGYSTKTLNVWLMCNLSSEVMMVTGFKYTTVQGQYNDVIESIGQVSGTTASELYIGGNQNETATNRAYALYRGGFSVSIGLPDGSAEYVQYGDLRIEVGNDTIYISTGM